MPETIPSYSQQRVGNMHHVVPRAVVAGALIVLTEVALDRAPEEPSVLERLRSRNSDTGDGALVALTDEGRAPAVMAESMQRLDDSVAEVRESMDISRNRASR